LDGILQCGDLGYFPNLARLDRATRQHAERDPEELGFAYYFRPPQPPECDPQLARTLNGDPDDLNTVRCPVICCHGNHEDFEELEKVTGGAALAPVDSVGRIHLLRSGEVTELAGLRIAALGGGPEHPDTLDAPFFGSLVSAHAARRLRRQTFDVVLAHGSPHGVAPCWGSRLLAELITQCQPSYAFYAHHERYIRPATIGRTRCLWHAGVSFQRVNHQWIGPPEPGCMAILRWTDSNSHEHTVVDGSWFQGITGITWQHI
jgi:hypothetical protein